MNVLIVASSKLPVPAVKGGAVPNLIEHLIQQNEKEKAFELTCCSLHDEEAEQVSSKYERTAFIWARQPWLIQTLDRVLAFILGKVLRRKKLLSLSYLFQVIWFSFFVGNILRKGNYDQVIFQNSVPMLFAIKLFSNRKKYANRYHLHMHSVPRSYYGNAEIIRECKSLICISQYVADEMLKDSRLGIDPGKIQIMYNCIDTDLFCPQKKETADFIRSHYGVGDKKIILFVGRLCKEKGIAELLQAMKHLEREDIVLMIVGSNFYKSGLVSTYEEYLRSLVTDISEKIIFTGYIDYDRIPAFYAAADVVVLPSMWEEPAGLTIVEAMACRRPVITTISGGIPEYTGEGNCILLERDEHIIMQLVRHINELIDDTRKAECLSVRAANRAEHYNLKYYFNQFSAILGKEKV